jgi:hypothetical protein
MDKLYDNINFLEGDKVIRQCIIVSSWCEILKVYLMKDQVRGDFTEIFIPTSKANIDIVFRKDKSLAIMKVDEIPKKAREVEANVNLEALEAIYEMHTSIKEIETKSVTALQKVVIQPLSNEAEIKSLLKI